MKTLPIVVLLFTVTCAFSQSGKIEIKNSAANSEGLTTFIYEPPNGLYLPEEVIMNVSCSEIPKKSVPLEKKGAIYEFSLKLPASSTVLFFAVSDRKQNSVDNNSGKGYVVYLKDPSTEGFEQTLIEGILNTGLAGYYLKLDYTNQDVLDQYDSLFASYPYLKNESAYATYLLVKFQINKEEARPELIDFAGKMAVKEDEESLAAAYNIFRRLEMSDEMEEVAKVAMEKYPTGEIAKDKFVGDYFSVNEKTESFISDKINEYIGLFGDPQDPNLDMLYYELLSRFLDKKDTWI
jgi:hypothetical protein